MFCSQFNNVYCVLIYNCIFAFLCVPEEIREIHFYRFAHTNTQIDFNTTNPRTVERFWVGGLRK